MRPLHSKDSPAPPSHHGAPQSSPERCPHFLRNALDAATEISFIATDLNGTIELFNRGSQQMLGYGADEMIGKQTPLLIHVSEEVEARAGELSAELGEPIEGFQTFVTIPRLRGVEAREWTYVRKNGERFPVRLTVTPVRNQEGELTGYLGIAEDISERKQVQDQLMESERRFRGAFDHAGIGMALVGTDGRCLEVSPSLCRILGYSASELQAKTFQDLTHPDDLDADLALLQEALAGKREGYHMAKRYFHSDGRLIWANLNVSVVRDSCGKPLYFVSQVEDITKQKRLESELLEAKERLELAAKASGVGIWDWRIPQDQMNWDDQMLALYGLRRDDFKGAVEAWQERLHPEDREKAIEEARAALDGAKEFDTVFRVVWPDGSIRHLRALGTVHRDDQGQPIRMIGMNWDVSIPNRQREQLKELAEKANAANKAKSQFLAAMSHEIRTPMNSVIGFCDLIQDTPLSAEQSDYARSIKSSAQDLLAIINDILDISKIEAGKMELEILPFSIKETLENCLPIWRAEAQRRSLDFRLEDDGHGNAIVSADKIRLRQVLINLVSNAMKFTKQGSVTLRIAPCPSQKALQIEIIDTGIGIAKDQQSRLFSKFTQADTSITRHYGGTGLGLAICKKLVSLMKGEIGLSSELGKGSRFWFTLPLAAAATPAPGSADAPAASPPTTRPASSLLQELPALSILVVDDNKANRKLLEKRLQLSGHQTATACNGAEAIAMACAGRGFDIVLMDCQMPEMDGYQAAKAIREWESDRGEEKRLPIIALTANAMEGDRDRCLQAGMDDYITKPINLEALARVLKKWG